MDTSKEVCSVLLNNWSCEEQSNTDYDLGFGSVLDLALALYPVIIFWNLQLQMHVKIGLMVLCGFGVV